MSAPSDGAPREDPGRRLGVEHDPAGAAAHAHLDDRAGGGGVDGPLDHPLNVLPRPGPRQPLVSVVDSIAAYPSALTSATDAVVVEL
ncbi:hypothetical protein [Streptomyces alboflavus]|uniref:hypothetical protein n=1 Tax=Streptomyces alboflavus TaxID=67267 RepID=UPI00368DBB8C